MLILESLQLLLTKDLLYSLITGPVQRAASLCLLLFTCFIVFDFEYAQIFHESR